MSLDPRQLAAIHDIAVHIAREAGTVLLEGWGARPSVQSKTTQVDLVTEYDRRAERLLVDRLRQAFPEHAVVGEEGAREGAGDDPDRLTWYVDPIDGTTNFAHGLPLFCSSLGLARGREPLVGVVNAPALGWTFSAARGAGAYRDGAPIRVSAVDRLATALTVTGLPYRTDHPHDNFAEMRALSHASHGARRLGSAALDLAFVACGWLDVYWERYIQTWDMVGGAALVLEAGGAVTDLDGAPFDATTGRILASNGRVHEEARAALEAVARAERSPWP